MSKEKTYEIPGLGEFRILLVDDNFKRHGEKLEKGYYGLEVCNFITEIGETIEDADRMLGEAVTRKILLQEGKYDKEIEEFERKKGELSNLLDEIDEAKNLDKYVVYSKKETEGTFR